MARGGAVGAQGGSGGQGGQRGRPGGSAGAAGGGVLHRAGAEWIWAGRGGAQVGHYSG